MNQIQFRAIRNSFQRDIMYIKGSGYGGDGIIEFPLMRKSINDDITFKGRKVKYNDISLGYTLTKDTNVYKIYFIGFDNKVSTLYIITLNDRIIYWTESSIYAPASDAFHALTEVYHGYESHTSNWQWFSEIDFQCQDHFWERHTKEVRYINKRIATKEECEEAKKKLYYNL